MAARKPFGSLAPDSLGDVLGGGESFDPNAWTPQTQPTKPWPTSMMTPQELANIQAASRGATMSPSDSTRREAILRMQMGADTPMANSTYDPNKPLISQGDFWKRVGMAAMPYAYGEAGDPLMMAERHQYDPEMSHIDPLDVAMTAGPMAAPFIGPASDAIGGAAKSALKSAIASAPKTTAATGAGLGLLAGTSFAGDNNSDLPATAAGASGAPDFTAAETKELGEIKDQLKSLQADREAAIAKATKGVKKTEDPQTGVWRQDPQAVEAASARATKTIDENMQQLRNRDGQIRGNLQTRQGTWQTQQDTEAQQKAERELPFASAAPGWERELVQDAPALSFFTGIPFGARAVAKMNAMDKLGQPMTKMAKLGESATALGMGMGTAGLESLAGGAWPEYYDLHRPKNSTAYKEAEASVPEWARDTFFAPMVAKPTQLEMGIGMPLGLLGSTLGLKFWPRSKPGTGMGPTGASPPAVPPGGPPATPPAGPAPAAPPVPWTDIYRQNVQAGAPRMSGSATGVFPEYYAPRGLPSAPQPSLPPPAPPAVPQLPAPAGEPWSTPQLEQTLTRGETGKTWHRAEGQPKAGKFAPRSMWPDAVLDALMRSRQGQ